MSNRPTRGVPLTDEERAAGEHMRTGSTSKWWGGVRFVRIRKYRNGTENRTTPKHKQRGRSDWSGASTVRKRK